MSERATQIAALLHEAGEMHHLVYRIADGHNPDSASRYVDWLINLSELQQILVTTPERSELVWLLVTLDKRQTETSPVRTGHSGTQNESSSDCAVNRSSIIAARQELGQRSAVVVRSTVSQDHEASVGQTAAFYKRSCGLIVTADSSV